MNTTPHHRRLTASELWRMARVGAPVPVGDGAGLVVPVTTHDLETNKGTERLYLLPTDGGAPRPLTSTESSASQPAPSPDGSRLAFVRKPHGEEHGQIHVMPLDGGEPRRLTDFPFGAFDPRWMPDGKRLICVVPLLREAPTIDGTRTLAEQRVADPVKAHVTEDRLFRFWDQWVTDGRIPHLFVIDVETGARRDLIPDTGRWFDFMEPTGQYDIAPDGSEIAFSANSSSPPHRRLRWAIFTAPVDGGPTRCMTPQNPADDLAPRYSPDGRFLLYGMQREWDFYADRVRLVLIDRATGKSTVLTEDWDRSASSWEFTPDGDAIVFQAEDHGHTNVYRLPLDSGTPTMICEGGTLARPRAARDGHVYFQYQDLQTPTAIARCPLAGGAMETLTHFNDELLASIDFGEIEDIEFKGAAGDAVQMFVVYPPDFDPGKRWPLVHLIHGGPHGIFGDQFHMRWSAHAFAAPGYVVAMVNFHGSTSFGQAFATSICGAWGDHPMTDVMAATDLLVDRGFIDPDRIAIAGGSYGGYLTAWLTSQTDRFTCAVCHAGVIDLPAMYASDVTQGRRRSFGGVPWDGREAVERWSPATFADGFKTPTLVIHGERDYRVPVAQGIELYGILKAMGVEARLVYYPDENHWILQPRNSLHWYGEVLGWLRRFLGGQDLAVTS